MIKTVGGKILAVVLFLMALAAVSRILQAKQVPSLISGGFNALSNLFRGTIQ